MKLQKNALKKALPLFAVLLIVLILLMVAPSAIVPATASVGLTLNSPTAGPHFNVIVTITHPDGTTETAITHNVVTNIGKNFSVGQLCGTTTTTAHWIAWCNDNYSVAPAATWTCLNNTAANEINTAGLTRAAGAYTLYPGNTGNCSISAVFSVTGTLGNITMIGLFWTASSQADNVMLAAASVSAVNVQNGDSLNGTWIVTQS